MLEFSLTDARYLTIVFIGANFSHQTINLMGEIKRPNKLKHINKSREMA